jgi:hypothetical protein
MQQVQSIKQLLVNIRRDVLGECIEACTLCEFACVSCADSCLGQDSLAMLRQCIRLNLDCADVCALTSHLVSRAMAAEPKLVLAQLEICASLCAACEHECRKLSFTHDQFHICAHACNHCESLCREAAMQVSQQH